MSKVPVVKTEARAKQDHSRGVRSVVDFGCGWKVCVWGADKIIGKGPDLTRADLPGKRGGLRWGSISFEAREAG